MRTHSRHNILISSSRQWNPGDEFILLGVRRLLEELLGDSLNYILWNRNPDLFEDRWRNPQFRPGFLTNSAVEPSLDLVDLIVHLLTKVHEMLEGFRTARVQGPCQRGMADRVMSQMDRAAGVVCDSRRGFDDIRPDIDAVGPGITIPR